ncbi:MAG TPA: MerR family transcriptional regulator [Rhodopila sp.]
MPDRRLLIGSPVSPDAFNRPLSPPAARAGSPSAPVRTEKPERLDLPAVRPSRAGSAMAIGPSEEWPAEPVIPDLLSSTDVEQSFARSARTLHRWEQRGHLTPVRVGHAKFYRAEDIRRLVSGQLEAAMGTHASAQTGTGQTALTDRSPDKKCLKPSEYS